MEEITENHTFLYSWNYTVNYELQYFFTLRWPSQRTLCRKESCVYFPVVIFRLDSLHKHNFCYSLHASQNICFVEFFLRFQSLWIKIYIHNLNVAMSCTFGLMFSKFFSVLVPRLIQSHAIHEAYRSRNAATAILKYFWVVFHPTSRRQTFGRILHALEK